FFTGSLKAPRLAERIGQRALLLGVATFAVGMVVLATMAQLGAGTAWLILPLMLNGFGQGMVIPLSLNTILSGVETAQAGMGAGTVTTMQAVGNAVGVTVVGVLLFSLLGQVEGADGAVAAEAATHAAHYGHAFALATLYNVAATVLSFVLFWRAWRRHA
ncbi:MAG: MFS transporter, partial [Ralstonia pickettii]|nr:MFS transporter [Ralstonia pickettii]